MDPKVWEILNRWQPRVGQAFRSFFFDFGLLIAHTGHPNY